MTTTSRNRQPLGHYATVNAYGAAESGAGPQLILTMLRTAQDRIATARGHIDRQEAQGKTVQISKAIALVDALRASLNHEQGGDIAANLESLYEYMGRRLLEANAHNDAMALAEVSGLLDEIRSAWEVVARAEPAAAIA